MIPVVRDNTNDDNRPTTLLTLPWFLYSSSPNNCKHVSHAGITTIKENLRVRHAFSDPSICCEERIRETHWRNFPPIHNLFFYMFQLKHLTITLIQIWTRILYVYTKSYPCFVWHNSSMTKYALKCNGGHILNFQNIFIRDCYMTWRRSESEKHLKVINFMFSSVIFILIGRDVKGIASWALAYLSPC